MVDTILQKAQTAFLSYKRINGKEKARFLRAIADEIENLGPNLIEVIAQETHLSESRIVSERSRTTGHCRMFASLVEEGSWVEARWDTALPNRTPTPQPDIRKMLHPLGPVVVFGAANFPLAYSTAGGDTASALAAGCPVVVKGHPAHPATSAMVAQAIDQAARHTGMPEGVFQHVSGGIEIGQALVAHPLTRAVGFTGSLAGGKALFDLAQQRPVPIPVFAEMSSINPVILLPTSLQTNPELPAKALAASLTTGMGQFCTCPGLVMGVRSAGLDQFIDHYLRAVQSVAPGPMLHSGIAENYYQRVHQTVTATKVTNLLPANPRGNPLHGHPGVAMVAAADFLMTPSLQEEVFGPFALVVICEDRHELTQVISHLPGQLTCTLWGEEAEIQQYSGWLNLLMEKAGRLIINGVPTGVEVCPSMQHGGPFPATTDARFTAVGPDAIKRFVRPIAYQNFPDSLLPAELQPHNPLGIWRIKDGQWGKD
jgi:2,5-dioxopentanoate dehydrogenase